MTAPRTFAYRALRQVLEAGQQTDEALNESRMAGMAARDRGFVRAILMAALRDYGRIKKILRPWLKQPDLMPPEVWAMLVLGAAQLLVLKTPPHAAVNETLELAVREGMVGFKGLLNAVLRRVTREGHPVFAKIPVTENYPAWLRQSWKNYGDRDTWYEILASEPPLDITVPQDIHSWAEKLGGEVITPQTVRIAKSGDVTKMPGFAEGNWWVQDAAAALPAALLGDIKNLDALDLCAAPGGKTMQLLAGGANVTAVDSNAQRLIPLRENLQRMKFSADVQCADVMRFEPARQFDIVLLDAPCSATGTLRRHPEILLHRQAEDVIRLAKLQAAMLTRAAEWVKPGGRLLYVVCSLQPEEGEEQIAQFLAGHQNFTANENHLRILPTHFAPHFSGGADGFFAAVLRKAA